MDWERWGGERPDRYQVGMLLFLLVSTLVLGAMLGGVIGVPGEQTDETADSCDRGLSAPGERENASRTTTPALENLTIRCSSTAET